MARSRSRVAFWGVQLAFAAAIVWSLERGPLLPGATIDPPFRTRANDPVVKVSRDKPLRISHLYNDPEVISDAELAGVLHKILPRFKPKQTKPNYVEHALRIWGVDATFKEPGTMSGKEMKEFLTDHGKYLASWGSNVEPLLLTKPGGVSVRYGTEEGASVHHDHWLACLTEGGVSLNEPVFTPGHRQRRIDDVLQQALRDVRVDEREVEWSSLAFGLWLAPVKSWKNAEGREVSFDLMARRLIRGTHWGVCSGTHRVYSLMALVRLDDEHKILSPAVRAESWKYLEWVRDQIKVSQFEDGHWPSNWDDGAEALKKPVEDLEYRKVIATGHHLEWLSIAPKELHPPREQVRKAARWCIETAGKQSIESIEGFYTFYSHVGAALAAWRKTTPPAFWAEWEKAHPPAPAPAPAKKK